MRPAYEIQVVLEKELGHDLVAECERDTTVVFTPAHYVFVGVGPQQIAKQALVGNVGGSHDTTDLLH